MLSNVKAQFRLHNIQLRKQHSILWFIFFLSPMPLESFYLLNFQICAVREIMGKTQSTLFSLRKKKNLKGILWKPNPSPRFSNDHVTWKGRPLTRNREERCTWPCVVPDPSIWGWAIKTPVNQSSHKNIWSFQTSEEPPGALQPPRAHLDASVMYPRGLALHAAGVATARAALHLHAGRPYQEVGRGGIDLTPRYLIYNRPCFADSRDGFLCEHKKFTLPGEQLLSPQGTPILHNTEVRAAPLAGAEKTFSVPIAGWQVGAEHRLPTTELYVPA